MTSSDLKTKLNKSLEFLKSELSQIRTGRASPSFVESLTVDAYGSRMTLKELGSITSLDSQTLVVSPWDKGLVREIAKAITESDLKINAVVDGNNVRVPFPSLTEERRKEFTKIASSKVEESKNSMRAIRQDAMKEIDKSFADKTIGEDEKFTQREEVDKIVKEYSEKADELGESKKSELMKLGN